MKHIFFHCRSGFERECAEELQELFDVLQLDMEISGQEGAGFVVANGESDAIHKAANEIRLDELIFTRQWFACEHLELDTKDRVSAIVTALAGEQGNAVLLETPDTSAGKELQGLCRGIRAPLEQALKKKRMLSEHAEHQIHVCFLSGSEAYVGVVLSKRASKHAMGIMRLRSPKDAPSRSTLKLEEAIHEFVPREQQGNRLRPKMHAVDLGAAPGGWTWQLVERGLSVVAVDNGNMDRKLMESGQVQHKRADGFTFRPSKKVDWMVCDMVDKPARVADLLAKWMALGWTKEAIVNFKLPMKRRYDEVMRCLDSVAKAMEDKGMEYEIRAKQLYHDREEITVHVRVFGK